MSACCGVDWQILARHIDKNYKIAIVLFCAAIAYNSLCKYTNLFHLFVGKGELDETFMTVSDKAHVHQFRVDMDLMRLFSAM